MTTLEVLRAARARIDTPEKWFGNGEFGPGNTCAILAFGGWAYDVTREPLHSLARAMNVDFPYSMRGSSSIVSFNNSHTHGEVLAAFDRAIANEQAREQEFSVEPVVVEELAVA